MAEKESFEAMPPAATGVANGKAAMFAPALHTGKPAVLTGAAANNIKAAAANGGGDNSGQVIQKGKLIVPTAIWILIVVGGLCFLSLLSSLNKTINTLDSLIEVEQASAKLNDKQQRDIEHQHHQHRHDSRLSEKSMSSISPTITLSWLAMPSWTSLEPVEQRPPRVSSPLLTPLDEMMSMVNSMVGGGGERDFPNPIQGSVTTFITSNDDSKDLEETISDVFRSLGEGSPVLNRLNKQSEDAMSAGTGGLHLMANIDNLNLNLGGSSDEEKPARRAPYERPEPQLQDLLLPLLPPIVELQPTQEEQQLHRHRHSKHEHKHHLRRPQPQADDVIIFSADPKPMQPSQELPSLLSQLLQGPVNQPIRGQDGDPHTFFISLDDTSSSKSQKTTLKPDVNDDIISKIVASMDDNVPKSNDLRYANLLKSLGNKDQTIEDITNARPHQVDPLMSLLTVLNPQNTTDKSLDAPVTTTTTRRPTTGSPSAASQEPKDPMAESMEQLADMVGSIFSLPSFEAVDQPPMKVEAQSRGNEGGKNVTRPCGRPSNSTTTTTPSSASASSKSQTSSSANSTAKTTTPAPTKAARFSSMRHKRSLEVLERKADDEHMVGVTSEGGGRPPFYANSGSLLDAFNNSTNHFIPRLLNHLNLVKFHSSDCCNNSSSTSQTPNQTPPATSSSPSQSSGPSTSSSMPTAPNSSPSSQTTSSSSSPATKTTAATSSDTTTTTPLKT